MEYFVRWVKKTMKETLHIYCRVSTRVQEDGTSLDMQKDLGRQKAKQLGMKAKVWNEGAASSHHEDLANRPKLMELMNGVENGSVKHLFVFNNDRLSRNEITQQTIKIALQRNDVVLYTRDGQFDLTNPSDKLFKTVLDGIAAYDNALRAERSRLGKIAKVRQGYWYGAPTPFGYKSVNKKLAIDATESKWVKKIFKWHYDGKALIWIKGQLDKNGVLARRGNLFSTGSINRLLKNTHYIGYYTWTDKKSGETITCECPSIVDETVWHSLAERREKELTRINQRNRSTKFYLLRDLLVCGECGSNMSGRIHELRRTQIYFCPKKTRDWKKGQIAKDDKWKRGKVGDRGCSMNRSLNIPITDTEVWQLVIDTVGNSSLLKEQMKQQVLQSKFQSDEENEKMLRSQKKKTDRLTKEITKVQSAIADVETEKLLGKVEPAIYANIKKQLDAELQRKRDQLEQTRIRTKELGNQKSWLDWLGKYGEQLELTKDLPKESRKEYLDGLLDRIEVRLDKKTNDHILTVFFRMGLVGDRIEYPRNKKGGYKVKEGRSDRSLVISREPSRDRAKRDTPYLPEKSVKKNDMTLPPKENTTSLWNSLAVW